MMKYESLDKVKIHRLHT